MTQEVLRQLPQVDAWLSSEQGTVLCAEYSRDEVVEVMRNHLERIRERIVNDGGDLPSLDSDEYTNLLRADLLARRTSSLRPVINATGIVIHTNLGRAPLAEEAIQAMIEAAEGYSNLEYDLDDGKRGSRNSHVEQLLVDLTGAEAALVVNNCAAAVVLALRALAGSGDVIVSRGELIEIGGSFRMPDVIAESGARMIEVGTTNRTRLEDYEQALTETSRVLLISHPSNYRIVGFTEAPNPKDLATLAAKRGLELVQDLGSGSLVDIEQLGAQEPTVARCLAQGAGIVTFSGDKLLGGPQAGIIVGRKNLVERLKAHPLARALRIDKLSLAALSATLRLYRPPHDPTERIPVLRMITRSPDDIARRAARLAEQLADLEGVTVSVNDGVSYAGGGALPMNELATTVVRVAIDGKSANEVARALRGARPPIVCRVFRDAVNLDIRTVLPGQTQPLIRALCRALK